MKRKVEKQKFKKQGGGSFRLSTGRRIKPGQVFDAYPSEIPEGFRDQVKPLGDKTTEEVFKETGIIESKEPGFKKESKGGGWFDVINLKTGKVLNEKSLREEEADKLVEALEAKG